MSGVKLKVKAVEFPKWKKIHREMRFAYLNGLTRTAEEGQRGVVLAVKKKFTIRSPWWKKTNKMGIKVKPAKSGPGKAWAAVMTRADWLVDHERGGMRRFTSPAERTGKGHHTLSLTYRAIPVFSGLRGAKRQIKKSQKLRKLFTRKKVFSRKTPGGISVYRKRGKKGDITIEKLYMLRERVAIRRRAPFVKPAVKAMKKHYKRAFIGALDETMRKLNPDFRRASKRFRAR